jgi:hypothetical protein
LAIRIKLIILLGILFLTNSSAIPPPKDPLKKNEEYVCVKWVGSSDPTQNASSVCLAWEKKEVPWFRRK